MVPRLLYLLLSGSGEKNMWAGWWGSLMILGSPWGSDPSLVWRSVLMMNQAMSTTFSNFLCSWALELQKQTVMQLVCVLFEIRCTCRVSIECLVTCQFSSKLCWNGAFTNVLGLGWIIKHAYTQELEAIESFDHQPANEGRCMVPWFSLSEVNYQLLEFADVESKLIVLARLNQIFNLPHVLDIFLHYVSVISSSNLNMSLELCLTAQSWAWSEKSGLIMQLEVPLCCWSMVLPICTDWNLQIR